MTNVYKATPATAHQPLKGLYISARLLSLALNVPLWMLYYALFPRPRVSWTLKEAVLVRLFRYLMPLNALCNLAPQTTDKTREVPQSELKETSFVWLEPVDKSLLEGVASDEKVKPIRIPGYIWPKETTIPADGSLVGLWIHGGGYMMGNGSENFSETDVARRVYRNTKIKNILSLDYRVSSEACHPAQLQDALAAYSHLVNTIGVSPSRIFLFGACSGGHLVLLLLRYLYEEKVLPMPGSVVLFSPLVDMTIDLDIALKKCNPRPNSAIDMLSASHYANLRFLGHHPISFLSSPYGSANRAPPGSYKSYPRTFISVGDAEALQRECTELYTLMHNDGVDVTLDVQKDAVHDFYGLGPLMPHETARANVTKRLVSWVEGIEKS